MTDPLDQRTAAAVAAVAPLSGTDGTTLRGALQILALEGAREHEDAAACATAAATIDRLLRRRGVAPGPGGLR